MRMSQKSFDMRRIALVGAAGLGFVGMSIAPVQARDWGHVSIGGLKIEDSEKFFDALVDLDADEIAEIRDDMKDAKSDIADAIDDVNEAREEVKDIPAGGAIFRLAVSAAAATVDITGKTVFKDLRIALDGAEKRLVEARSDVGEAEYEETLGAITDFRKGATEIEASLDELLEAMRS